MMCFTETWLSETVSDDFVSIDGFYVGGEGGGTEQRNLERKRGWSMCVHKQTVVSSKERNDEIQTVFTGY